MNKKVLWIVGILAGKFNRSLKGVLKLSKVYFVIEDLSLRWKVIKSLSLEL